MESINKFAQFKIQQMAFMLIAVFIFFTLVALFFLQVSLGGLKFSAQEFEREQVLSVLSTLSEIPELSCYDGSVDCLDVDKLLVLRGTSEYYKHFWPIASIRVHKVGSNVSSNEVICKGPRTPANCTYFDVYDSGQTSVSEYATYVAICTTSQRSGRSYRDCEMGKILVGMKVLN
jgi:hypothetical protein